MDLNCSPIGRRHLLSDSRKMCDNFCTLPTIRCDWSLLPLFLLSTSIVDCILKRHTMPPISLPHNVQHHCHGCIITVPCPPWKHLSTAIRWTTCATKVFTLYVADRGRGVTAHTSQSQQQGTTMQWSGYTFHSKDHFVTNSIGTSHTQKQVFVWSEGRSSHFQVACRDKHSQFEIK